MCGSLQKWFKRKITSSGSSLTTPEDNQRTPLPKAVLTVLFFLLLFNAMTATTVFSYVPKLVKSFGTSEVNTGKYVGLLGSSLFVGQAFFSFFWGYLADTKGLKKITIISCSMLTANTLAFGFSSSFYWAIITRFLQGCSIGLLVTCKAYISVVCDNTNMAFGMTAITTSFYTGMIIGPAMGGYFVFPHEQYPTLFSENNIFARFPILLPNLIISLGFVGSLISAIFILPPDQKKRNSEGNDEAYLLDPVKKIKRYDNIMKDFEEEEEEEIEKEDASGEESFLTLSTATLVTPPSNSASVCYFQMVETRTSVSHNLQPTSSTTDAVKVPKKTLKEKWKQSNFHKLVSNKWCMLSCLLYACFGFYSIGYDELQPLFLATSIEYNGVGFTTGEIGSALLIASVIGIFIQTGMLPFALQKFKSKKVHMVNLVFSAIVLPFLPIIKELYYKKTSLWIVLCIHQTLMRTFFGGVFLSVNMMINNSVPQYLIGSANGIAMGIAAIGRLLSPTINGSIYSWSLTNVKNSANGESALGFPFNQYFPFLVLSIFALASVIFASFFPRSLNEQYRSSADPNTKNSSTNGESVDDLPYVASKSNKIGEGEIVDDDSFGKKKITNFSMRYSRMV